MLQKLICMMMPHDDECMRLAMEDTLYNAGVDIVLNWHCYPWCKLPVHMSVASMHECRGR